MRQTLSEAHRCQLGGVCGIWLFLPGPVASFLVVAYLVGLWRVELRQHMVYASNGASRSPQPPKQHSFPVPRHFWGRKHLQILTKSIPF